MFEIFKVSVPFFPLPPLTSKISSKTKEPCLYNANVTYNKIKQNKLRKGKLGDKEKVFVTPVVAV